MNEFLKSDSLAPLIATGAILGTIFGVIVRSWTAVKNFFNSVAGVFIVKVELNDDITSKVVLAYLLKKYKRNKSGKRIYSSRHESFRDGKFGHIPFELFGNQTLFFWNGWIPFLFYVMETKESDDKRVISWGDNKQPPTFKASIVFLRFTVNVDDIIHNSSKDRNDVYWNKTAQRRFFIKKVPNPDSQGGQRYSVGTSLEWFQEGVYRLIGRDISELGKSLSRGSAIDNLYFPDKIKKLIEEVRTWHGLKDWYANKGISWKRGWCLYGPPGTGKTVLVRAIAEDLDMPLFVFALGRMTDTDLEKSWNDMQAYTPCIALFEDFDTVFHGRENIYGKPTLSDQIAAEMKPGTPVDTGINKGQLSFGCLLNCIDGADKTNGIFTVFTTNHIDKLDIALGQPRTNSDGSVEFISTRPGRIDKAIKLDYMNDENKIQLAKKIFDQDPKGLEKILKRIADEPNKQETPAQFQEACTQLMLELLWSEKPEVEEKKLIPVPEINPVVSKSRFSFLKRMRKKPSLN